MEQQLRKKLKAYNGYHKKNGVESVLKKQVFDIRLKVCGINNRISIYTPKFASVAFLCLSMIPC